MKRKLFLIIVGITVAAVSFPLWGIDKKGIPFAPMGDKIITISPSKGSKVTQAASLGHKVNFPSVKEMNSNYLQKKSLLENFAILTNHLPFGVAGQLYNANLYTTSIADRKKCNWTAEGLPQGLNLESRGSKTGTCSKAKISGVSEETGNFSVKIKVVDESDGKISDEKKFNLHVDDNIVMNIYVEGGTAEPKLVAQNDYDQIEVKSQKFLRIEIAGFAKNYNWSLNSPGDEKSLLQLAAVKPSFEFAWGNSSPDNGKPEEDMKVRYLYVDGSSAPFEDIKITANDGAGNKASATIGKLTFLTSPMVVSIDKIDGKKPKKSADNVIINTECGYSTSVEFEVTGGKPPYEWCVVAGTNMDIDKEAIKNMDFNACVNEKKWSTQGASWGLDCIPPVFAGSNDKSACYGGSLTGSFDPTNDFLLLGNQEYYEDVGVFVKDTTMPSSETFPAKLFSLTYWVTCDL
jgi:hypothetical protein